MSDPSEILKRRVRAVLDGSLDARGLHFFCQVGGTYHDYGMLTLQLSGMGKVLLGWRRDDEKELFSVELHERDAMRFYQMLQDLPFWEANPARRTRRHDEEINIHLRLSDLMKGTWGGVQFWVDDMKDFPMLRDLMYRVNRLAMALSDGDIPAPDLGFSDSKED